MADTKPDPKAVMAFVKEHNVQILDLRFTDIPGLWHHVSYPIGQLSESSFEEGFGMDGSSIRGWAAIHESDMLLIPDAGDVHARSLHRSSDAGDGVRRHRSRDQAALRPRPALHRQEGGDVPRVHRPGRHRLLRRRSRVLHLRQRALRPERARGLLLHRRRRRPLELGTRGEQPRLSSALQGRLLPGSADRPLPGPAHRDGADHAELRA